MANDKKLIADVSDTALWVAHYRAVESEKPNALFKDPFAKILVGERGKRIAESMGSTSRYTDWTVVIRTYVIDHLLRSFIQQHKIDTVINLGAGLDTRPYRMDLPHSLKWIEVDYPHMIDHKSTVLAKVKPQCHLERVKMDLSDRKKRAALLKDLNSQSKNILILTEGVIPYLTEDQVAELAADFLPLAAFRFWIAEYMAPEVYPHLRNRQMRSSLKNAPFQFFPKDWLGFFMQHGWKVNAIRYLGEETMKLNRKPPLPRWTILLRPFINIAASQKFQRMTAFVVFEKQITPS